MPNGNKEMYFHHIGGVFLQADTFTRFLRDRLGPENVLFVSGTDSYGSPAFEQHRQLVASGAFDGSVEDFARMNHDKQKAALDAYGVAIDLFASSAVGRAGALHAEFTGAFIRRLYHYGYLTKMSTMQFYDTARHTFLNGRQVLGRCPVCGEKGYADECAYGHQYLPEQLVEPVSTVSGNRPEMREAVNWYLRLTDFRDLLKKWVDSFRELPTTRPFAASVVDEFLEPPVLRIKKEHIAPIEAIADALPPFRFESGTNNGNMVLVFDSLEERETACKRLSERHIRYRTGKTLVPFRLTGNIPWGVPAPDLEGPEDRTVWVWPESLLAPISFTMACLEASGKDTNGWKDWWCAEDSQVYQFLGVDNLYFYGPAEMAMFMGWNSSEPKAETGDEELRLPALIVNNHLLFMNKKSASSDEVKPPTALELLAHYTPEQLRAHFLGLGLGLRSVSFQPKALDTESETAAADPVLKEGNLLTNVFNRFARTCFYTAQKYYDGRIPAGEIGAEVLAEAASAILEYERLMHRAELHLVMALLDTYIRSQNKYASRWMREAELNNDEPLRKSALLNMFYMLKTAAVLVHPIAPEGTERIAEYLRLDRPLWSWDTIFEPLGFFINDPAAHRLKYLEPRTDFFKKHPSQLSSDN
jgi:methionyl-tRNA synthetase